MRRQDAEIPAPGGLCHGTLHIPGGDGPWPGVLVFPDAGGVRETFRRLADRLAGLGYVVLVPDIYYRGGDWNRSTWPPCSPTSGSGPGWPAWRAS